MRGGSVRRMTRVVLVTSLLLLAACGMETDERPRTFVFINEAILAPSCATANCHSSFAQADGYSFSTVAEGRASLEGEVRPGAPEDSNLWLVIDSPGGDNQPKQMPRDQPMSGADKDLIYQWILEGADGLVEGAQ